MNSFLKNDGWNGKGSPNEMKLIDLLNEELVVLEIKGTTKKDIIAELSSMLDKQGRLHDKHGFENAVLKREATSTTGIGFGVAIPHGKVP